ncbi:T7SS effector LXG polymorphic toxin [Lentibacillus salinarum]|uniref:T7SS effector LXG polymorphic toxin n=1 Tax=Lentibacillus salinarum TaxID=446820 RepID=A0ABW3ZSV6_9BACI
MGHKVDISEVTELSDDLKTASEDIKSSLNRVDESIDKMTAMSSFSGKTAKEAKNYFNDLHKTILESFDSLFNYLDDHLKKHLQTFQSRVDASESAIIESDYLNDTEADVNDDYDRLSEGQESVRETISSVSDITSARHSNSSTLDADKADVIKTITNLEEDLDSFTSEGNQEISQTEDLLHQIEVAINNAGAVTGQTRFTDYKGNSATVGLPALKGYIDEKTEEAIENLDPDAKACVEKAVEDYKNGIINKETLDSIKSGVIASGTAFLTGAANKYVTGKVSEQVASSIVQWAQRNTSFFVDRGLVAAPVTGNVTTFTESPSILSQAVRTGARYGVPIVGSAIDFGIQVSQGEDPTDAAIKTAGHLGAGMAGAAVGTAIGGPIGTLVGFGIGVAGSVAFDFVYDNKEKIGEAIGDAVSGIGDAVSGLVG